MSESEKEIKHQEISDKKPSDNAPGNWNTAKEYLDFDDRKIAVNIFSHRKL